MNFRKYRTASGEILLNLDKVISAHCDNAGGTNVMLSQQHVLVIKESFLTVSEDLGVKIPVPVETAVKKRTAPKKRRIV